MARNEFAARLARRRVELGYSQSRMAKELGMVPSSIHGYEAGAREPSLDRLLEIAGLLGCTTDWLLGIEGLTSERAKVPAWAKGVAADLAVIGGKREREAAKTLIGALARHKP
ncbi:MAG: helix-turn-helix transcriptional regulator [Deltaproteobacteria bacterium]|jgi:transcriptional regulator with XRE-family HTH domain|nr:helix-turn-helix transcriptional regulator [Deltaproteobacteria bacterium]